MVSVQTRRIVTVLATPVAKGLLRAGITPDMITIAGTVGVTVGALGFYPRGKFFAGTLVITAFVFSDVLDGTMARITGRSSEWGAFLDSTLDRVGDAAIFGGLFWWFASSGRDNIAGGLALFCLMGGMVVSYSKARAEGLGLTCNVGIAERTERLVVILVATGLDGLGVPYVLAAALWILALAIAVTIAQRMLTVYQQTSPRRIDTREIDTEPGR
jgi:CDP-diacylglycerol---glycerol-3-phosphate 3-phosphatidyltransferase